MHQAEFSKLASAVEREGKIGEQDARRLVAVAQGKDTGTVGADEALDLVVHAFTGRAIEIIDEATGRLPFGVGIDETRLLDEALAAVRGAVTGYNPARGDFGARVTHRIWRAVTKRTRAVLKSAPPFVPLATGKAPGANPDERTAEPPDPRTERAQERHEGRVAIRTWAGRRGEGLVLSRPIRARRRTARG